MTPKRNLIRNPKPTNPAHHNAGRQQHPSTAFSAKVNWLILQCRAATSNLSVCSSRVFRDSYFATLSTDAQLEFDSAAKCIVNALSLLDQAEVHLREMNAIKAIVKK